MPRFDGTGPDGFGPFTGRGMGYCIERVKDIVPTYPRRGLSRGSYIVPAASLLYYLGRRHILPSIRAGYGQRMGRGRRSRIW